MVAAIDFFEVDLPGEIHKPAAVIPSTPTCAVCLSRYDVHGEDTGVCSGCARRLPGIGGCGQAVRLVAGLTGDGDGSAAIAHLATCPECRTFLDWLADISLAGSLEADAATPHAELVRVAA